MPPPTTPDSSAANPDTPLPTPAPWTPPSPLPNAFETERLVLRWWEDGDAAGMFEAIEADRMSYLPWLPWVLDDNKSVEGCLAVIDRQRGKRTRIDPVADDFTIAIFDRSSGAVVGGTGLHRIHHASHEGEIGYWIRPERRGTGLCSEAVRGLISWAFTAQTHGGFGLRRLHIRCASQNLASSRVPRKIGLREEGRLRQDRWTLGRGWDDTLVWGVLIDEWDIQQQRLRTH